MKVSKAVLLPLALVLVFTAGLFVHSLAFFPVRGTRVVAAEANPHLVMTGRDERAVGSRREILPDERININTATVEELMLLDGIGETLAQRIVRYRKEHGRFESIEELMEVKGIGEKTFANIRDDITVGDVYENSGS